MPRRSPRFLLPFVVPAKGRKTRVTEEMEMAAILSLVESEREKGKGLILKRGPERLVFVAKAYYPLWLAPSGKRNLLFDGYNFLKHTEIFDILPETQAFVDEVQGSSESREAYSAVLSNYLNYFQGFAGTEERTIDGLITSPDFIKDFTTYRAKAKSVKKPIVDRIVLSPLLEKSAVSASVHEILDLRASLNTEIKRLRKTMKLLSITTKKHVKTIRSIVRSLKKDYDKKISKAKSSLTAKRREIKKKYDEEITQLTRTYEITLQSLHQELIKTEKEKHQLSTEKDRHDAGLRSSRNRKDESEELQWRQKLEENRKKLTTLERVLKDLDKRIAEINNTKKIELSKLRDNYDAQVKAAMYDLREIEASLEAETRMRENEIMLLEDRSSKIVNQVDKLLKEKETALKNVEDIGIPKTLSRYTLFYIPFYLTCYQTDTKKRFLVYAPSIAGDMRVLTRFKGIFGAAKIRSLLEPRSKHITDLLNQIVPFILRNPVFENEVNTAGEKVNVLQNKDTCEKIDKGLVKLKKEEWISENEFSELKSLVTK